MALSEEDKQWLEETFATKERLEQLETTLLTEFHKWASPNEMRQRATGDRIHATELDVQNLQDDVKKLKEKLGLR